jgi:hypothetical protein
MAVPEHLQKYTHPWTCPGKCTKELYEGIDCCPGQCEYDNRKPEEKEEVKDG